MNVANVNKAFPKYPITVEDKGWVYGVWYCGTSWTRVRLHGQYPPTFLKRALALFPEAEDILHCPSGTIEGMGITVDLKTCDVRKPMIQADAARLPFNDNSFDLLAFRSSIHVRRFGQVWVQAISAGFDDERSAAGD